MSKLVFEKYEIIRRLAIGGMGEIFLAKQVGVAGFERLVILKNLLPDLAEEEKFITEFLDEARVAATLNHPNIVSIFEVGKWEGVYFIAMEYIRGESISNLIVDSYKQKKRIPPSVAARVVHDAALGLDHAHSAKDTAGRALYIVHRDISPQNIMVRDDGVTKIVDFGIAKAANRSTRTMTGRVKGKMSYMSPEQALGDDLDGRSDQFALGIVLWEMCVGRRLFKGEHAADTMQKVLEAPIPDLTEKLPGFPPMLADVVKRMLERDRDVRFPTCRDAANDLGDYLESVSKRVNEREVASFVSSVCGDRIEEATKNLTPTGDNFLIDLGDGPTVDIGEKTLRAGARKRGAGPKLAIAAVLAVAVAVGGFFTYRATRPASPAVTAAASKAGSERPVKAGVGPPAVAAVLELTSVPPGATVMAGKTVLGSTPVTINTLVPKVEHLLVLEKRNFESKQIRITLAAGKVHQEKVTLAKRKPGKKGRRGGTKAGKTTPESVAAAPPLAKAAGTGFLSCKTTPYTTVFFKGKALGETPFARKSLPAGTHTLRFVNQDEGVDEKRQVTIAADQVTKFKPKFK